MKTMKNKSCAVQMSLLSVNPLSRAQVSDNMNLPNPLVAKIV
jgi:hypothetical protein